MGRPRHGVPDQRRPLRDLGGGAHRDNAPARSAAFGLRRGRHHPRGQRHHGSAQACAGHATSGLVCSPRVMAQRAFHRGDGAGAGRGPLCPRPAPSGDRDRRRRARCRGRLFGGSDRHALSERRAWRVPDGRGLGAGDGGRATRGGAVAPVFGPAGRGARFRWSRRGGTRGGAARGCGARGNRAGHPAAPGRGLRPSTRGVRRRRARHRGAGLRARHRHAAQRAPSSRPCAS